MSFYRLAAHVSAGVLLLSAGTAHAQGRGLQPAAGPCPEYKSAEVARHIDTAYRLVGDELPTGLIPGLFILPRAAGMCAPPRVAAFRIDNTVLPPTRAFDQLSYVGNAFVGAWVLQTDEGIILFDAMNDTIEAQSIIEPGLRQLGLDPAQIRYLVVTHGHADHWGGAKHFQDTYGTRVLVGAPDAALLAAAPSDRADRLPPKVDQEVTDGTKLELGSTTVHLYITEGHTPGTLSAIFPVSHRGAAHTAAIFGGYGLPLALDPDTAAPPRHSGLLAYMRSVERWRELGRNAGVDVGLSTHPFFDATTENIERVSSGAGAGNPWVMGSEQWVRFMDANLEVARTVAAMQREHPVRR